MKISHFEKDRFEKRKFTTLVIVTCAVFSLFFVLPADFELSSAKISSKQPVRRVNVPYWADGSPFPSYSIFWFGKVTPTSNYADVRMIYYDSQLEVTLHIIDRLLQYDTSPSPSDLTNWDSVTLYLITNGNSNPTLDKNAYRLDAQLNWWETREDWQAGYHGDGSTWVADSFPFTTETGWRGDSLNDNSDDKGWTITFTIPFSSLGLSSAPQKGTVWGLAMAVHDRDDASAPVLPDTVWPEQMDANNPSTWGNLVYGIPGYNRPLALPSGITTIRNGLNGSDVVDGQVGGNTTCGEGLDHWTEWGETNYAGYEQINIQNQWDISDYPCFSKFFITFPLNTLPAGKVIISASLTMHLFGNSGGGEWGEPPDSYIQALTVGEDWDESTLTWNNAPLARENISGTWVKPMDKPLEWPGIPYQWDVSRAVAEAYLSGEPLRLALYSADGERHTGKYFSSSDTGDWNAVARPSLDVVWGTLCDSLNTTCTFNYLPITIR